MRFLFFIAVTMMLTMAAELHAAEIRTVRILTGDDNSFVTKTAASLADALSEADPALNIEIAAASEPITAEGDVGKRVIVLVGERAFGSVDTGTDPVLALVPQRALAMERKRNTLSVIYFEQPLARLLNLSALLLSPRGGQAPVIGIVVSPNTLPMISTAEMLARERKLGLHIETVQSEADVGRAIAKIGEDSSLLIAIPDAVVHTPNTVQSVLLVSYHAGVPVLGYSAAYLRAGAAVALYSTPEQLARQAAEVIANYRANKTPPNMQWPRRFTVGINATVLRSLGMTVPAGELLEKKLASVKE